MTFILIVFVTALPCCKKFVQVPPPGYRPTSVMVFASDSSAREAVYGLYARIMGDQFCFLNAGLSILSGLSADELERVQFDNFENQFYTCSLKPSNYLNELNFWGSAYTYIYHANRCIEEIGVSPGITKATKDQLTGQMQFMRALCYFYLVSLYGDVPLTTITDANKNAVLSRIPVNKVYDLIVNDLIAAQAILPDTSLNTIPNKMTAIALLARVYLYKQEWSKAEMIATTLIQNGRYRLVSDLSQVFKSVSTEVIFQLASVYNNINSTEGFLFIPNFTGKLSYKLTADLLNAFDSGDLRQVNWVKTTSTGSYPYKYKIWVSLPPATEYNVVLRLAEQYLIRAEARVQQNNITGAVEDINAIRSRAGLPALPATLTQSGCLAAIEKERRLELFAEWGHRWLDLKRTDRANAVLSAMKGSDWQTSDQLYPIPISEISANPFLIQNPGY